MTRGYRYEWRRGWDPRLPEVLFVLLNPSTADAEFDDPTTRRCQAFARELGFGSITVVNLFALRATDPRDLLRARDPVGPGNDAAILGAAARAARIVAGWGNGGSHLGRDRQVLTFLRSRAPLECFGLTARGAPRHPLYLAARSRPRTWSPSP